MIIIARVKDGKDICGYITKDNHFIPLNETYRYKPDNILVLKDGTWKAKNGYKIVSINKDKIDINIMNRNTSLVGKPNLIYNYSFSKLSKTQKFILDQLEINNPATINKLRYSVKITLKDLSALTAYTGLEYSLFERNDSYVIAKGTKQGMHLSSKDSAKLLNGKYKWVGHTHPGNTFWCLMPSDSDYDTLKLFNQQKSTIYNSVGKFYIFEREE